MSNWNQLMRKPKPPTPDWTWQDDWKEVDDDRYLNSTTYAEVNRNEEWSGRDTDRWYVKLWGHVNLTSMGTTYPYADKTRTFADPQDAIKVANEECVHEMVERQIDAAYAKGWRDALTAVRSGIKSAAELIDPQATKSNSQ